MKAITKIIRRVVPLLLAIWCFWEAYRMYITGEPYHGEKTTCLFVCASAKGLYNLFGLLGTILFFVGLGCAFIGIASTKLFIFNARQQDRVS